MNKFPSDHPELWYGEKAIPNPVSYTGANVGEMSISGLVDPKKIEKTWGYELIYQNNPFYCMKRLIIKPNKFTSLHLHLSKSEVLQVESGVLILKYIDHGEELVTHLDWGMAFHVAPGLPHQLINEEDEDLVIMEASTTSFDDDSIRLWR